MNRQTRQLRQHQLLQTLFVQISHRRRKHIFSPRIMRRKTVVEQIQMISPVFPRFLPIVMYHLTAMVPRVLPHLLPTVMHHFTTAMLFKHQQRRPLEAVSTLLHHSSQVLIMMYHSMAVVSLVLPHLPPTVMHHFMTAVCLKHQRRRPLEAVCDPKSTLLHHSSQVPIMMYHLTAVVSPVLPHLPPTVMHQFMTAMCLKHQRGGPLEAVCDPKSTLLHHSSWV